MENLKKALKSAKNEIDIIRAIMSYKKDLNALEHVLKARADVLGLVLEHAKNPLTILRCADIIKQNIRVKTGK